MIRKLSPSTIDSIRASGIEDGQAPQPGYGPDATEAEAHERAVQYFQARG